MNEAHREFIGHLDRVDPLMAKVVRAHGPLDWPTPRPPFEALLRAIVGQQVSTRAADTVFERVVAAFGGALTPVGLLELPEDALKAAGMGRQKVAYANALATAWIDDASTFSALHDLSDEDVVAALTQIKGIGKWTAQMFLMFTLQRPDVFAPGDLGLKRAMANLLGLAMDRPDRDFAEAAARWAPYRSRASLHLWHSLR